MDGGNQWSHLLPKDLLILIVKRLKNRIYVLRLLAVCKSWRSSLLSFLQEEGLQYSPLKLPLLIPPDYPINEISGGGYITVSESTIYCLEPSQQNPNASILGKASSSSKAILVEVEEGGPDKLRRLCHLSALQERRHKKFAKELNLLDLQISEISKVYQTKSVDSLFNNDGSILQLPRVKKVVVLSPNPMRAIADSYVVMAIFDPGRLCFLKSGEEEWTTIFEPRSGYTDVITCKGKFYAITDSGVAVVIDSLLKVTKIASPIHGGGGHQKHLVDSYGDILLVDRYLGRVYKLDEARRDWVEMTSLGDRVLFVDVHCTFSVSARVFTACKGNCIYYGSMCSWRYREVFNLEEGLDGEWRGLDECFLGVGGVLLSLDVSHMPGLSWALVDI
ncbi:hypothetical protein L1049_015632 [Liquidambar formosana]|uniref:KIB1-4 beta-propeller domain-containing protein n=1 Tax=Liquidambar formosana TaxID=63359 RepID=A0AAP0RZ74_LIQFO